MNQVKQNILVSAILFLSLLLSVALSYAITPNSATVTKVKPPAEQQTKQPSQAEKLNQSLQILLPKKGQ